MDSCSISRGESTADDVSSDRISFAQPKQTKSLLNVIHIPLPLRFTPNVFCVVDLLLTTFDDVDRVALTERVLLQIANWRFSLAD